MPRPDNISFSLKRRAFENYLDKKEKRVKISRHSSKMSIEPKKLPPLPYTICFCIEGDDVLMMHRLKRPNAGKDNGLGGKRDYGITKDPPDFSENPNITNMREVWEESGIDLEDAESVRFAGILSWAPISDLRTHIQGLYLYTARLKPEQRIWKTKDIGEDGSLEWQNLSWVCDFSNPTVVSNIPYFLPHILIADKPHLYEISYEEKEITGMRISILPKEFAP